MQIASRIGFINLIKKSRRGGDGEDEIQNFSKNGTIVISDGQLVDWHHIMFMDCAIDDLKHIMAYGRALASSP
jgi:hypothetical protein